MLFRKMRIAAKSGGFTLLEVLIAMAILTGVIITLSQTWSGNYNRLRKITLANNVATLLERKMTEIEAQYRAQPVSQIPEEDSGDFGDQLSSYSWTLKSRKFEMPNVTALLTSQEGGANELLITMVKQLSEFLSKAIKEVTVSIIFKSGSKKATYEATTYFVDWEQELNIPGGGISGGSSDGGTSSTGGSSAEGTGK